MSIFVELCNFWFLFDRQESHKQLDDEIDLEAEIEEEMRQEELARNERGQEILQQKLHAIAVKKTTLDTFNCQLTSAQDQNVLNVSQL